MSKGALTRHAILDRATDLASLIGLDGITIGALADDLGLSKSGLFGHFKSKEALQIQVLEHAAGRFIAGVVRPALGRPRGEPRVRELFERWISWAASPPQPGGCVFVGAAAELDDKPGPVRDRLVGLQREWQGVIATTFRLGIEAGAFRSDVDPEDSAQNLLGIMLAFHHTWRLLGDPRAEQRARSALEGLLATVRTPVVTGAIQ
jgi:AcrR family transcriptional regulator